MWSRTVTAFVLPLLCLQGVGAINFPYESIQLTDDDVANHPELQFGNLNATRPNVTCRAWPGEAGWPSEAVWTAFNASLGGALIKPVPAAASCYSGASFNQATCARVQASFSNTSFHAEDPISVGSTWPQGNTCSPAPDAGSTCTMGGFPVLVVNATTVKHIQAAVNFARNNNIRLVIKNTGHDFLGRSLGGGALSIWTHNLKGMEFLPTFSVARYTGKAVKYAAGIMSYELSPLGLKHNITLITPGGSTVGAAGGFIQGGGHSGLTSYYGLASDQVLSVNLVTADGRFITVDPSQNTELYWAIRGGGGGTYGVVTSVVIRVFNRIPTPRSSISFSTGPDSNITNEAFWRGIKVYHQYVPSIVKAGAIGYNYLRAGPNGSFSFQNTITAPGMSPGQLEDFTMFMTRDFIKAGVPMINPRASYSDSPNPKIATRQAAPPVGNIIGASLLSTRLLPRENFEKRDLFEATMAAIRNFTEVGGYTFHGINYSPTKEIAGWPGRDSGVNPHFRRTVTHAEAFEGQRAFVDMAKLKARHDRFQQFFQPWRDVSPTAGSYQNEADVMEPHWQWAFFGENYPRLLEIKKRFDPWDVFYATTAVGSEYWQIQGPQLMKTQDGKLCRLAHPSSTWSVPAGFREGEVFVPPETDESASTKRAKGLVDSRRKTRSVRLHV